MYDASGLRAGLIEWLDSLGNAADLPGCGAGRRAAICAWCNEKDRAFEWLDRAIEQGDPTIGNVEPHLAYDALRDDPRYAELLRRIGVKSNSKEFQSNP
ncbi:MAG: hypothetical protein IID38_05655 [Planctomycetes bacterium]|nr:hypothetical protein [Planctomycetota bacterium]